MYRTVCKIFLVLSVSPINQVAEILSVVAQIWPCLLVGMAHEAPPFLQLGSDSISFLVSLLCGQEIEDATEDL